MCGRGLENTGRDRASLGGKDNGDSGREPPMEVARMTRAELREIPAFIKPGDQRSGVQRKK